MRARSILLSLLATGALGCGGTMPAPGVDPVLTVNWPDRNRGTTVDASTMSNAIDVQFFRYRTSDPVLPGRFVIPRPFTSPSAAITVRQPLDANLQPGLYTLGVATYTGSDGLGTIISSAGFEIRIQADGEITRPDGSALNVFDRRREPIVSTRLRFPDIKYKVGEPFALFFIGTVTTFFGTRDQQMDAKEFKLEWIEGRDLLTFYVNENEFLGYRGLRPGIVKFRIRQEDYVSDVYQIEIIP